MKKALLVGVILLLSIGLVSCSDEKVSQSNQENSATEVNVNEDVNSNITEEDFIKAIRQLKPNSHVSDSLIKDLDIQQVKVNHNEQFYIAWTEDITASPDLPMIAIFNASKEPIYIESFRERIESVKFIGEFMLDKGLIEVTSYGASGSFSGQWVNLLMLNEDSVNDIWEYQTISNENHSKEGVMEYSHDYSTYLIIPSYQQQFPRQEKTEIIVNYTSEKVLVDKEDKVVSKSKATNELSFIWDDELQEFLKTDKGYTETILYENTEYGFRFSLPKSWEDYKIVTDSWEGTATNKQQNKVVENGPILSIRHPEWTDETLRQDIPIMVFTLEQWSSFEEGRFHIGAAPVGPRKLGQNNKYVFALPPRYNFAFPEGYREVEEILGNEPLQVKYN